jgi:ketosteroid isomerase-like protein
MARPTGRIYESDFVHLVTFKDGKIVRFQEFFDTYLAGEAFRP